MLHSNIHRTRNNTLFSKYQFSWYSVWVLTEQKSIQFRLETRAHKTKTKLINILTQSQRSNKIEQNGVCVCGGKQEVDNKNISILMRLRYLHKLFTVDYRIFISHRAFSALFSICVWIFVCVHMRQKRGLHFISALLIEYTLCTQTEIIEYVDDLHL